MGDAPLPDHLLTKVACQHLQNDKDYCLMYSLVTALHYMGFASEALILSEHAKDVTMVSQRDALLKTTKLLGQLLPQFGQPSKWNVKRQKKHVRNFTLPDIVDREQWSPYAMVVLPKANDGSLDMLFVLLTI